MRRFCRVAAEGFSKSAVKQFYPIQNREATMLALSLMKNPILEKDFERHTASIMFSINYQFLPAESGDHPHAAGIANFLECMLHEMQPGARLVEYLPWLRYVPSRCVVYCTIDHELPPTSSAGSPSGNATHSTGSSRIICIYIPAPLFRYDCHSPCHLRQSDA